MLQVRVPICCHELVCGHDGSYPHVAEEVVCLVPLADRFCKVKNCDLAFRARGKLEETDV